MTREGLVDEITPEEIGRIWPVALPVRVRRMALGTNNRSFIVDCDDRTCFLKSYDNAPDPERCALEHRITAAIAAQHPPFAVPETILSRSGEAHVLHDGRYYALSTFIPGSVARYGDRDDAFACGRSLAELHAALIRVDPASQDEDHHGLGDLATVHPLVPDPERAIGEAIGDTQLADETAAILAAIDLRHATATAGWPLTWIHWDYYPTNVLLQSHRVTGIVDFEFAGLGHRAMDVAIGLYAFAFGQPDIWTLIDRFASGYLSMLELSPEEIEAVPTLILTREARSLTHWTGRFRQGLRDQPGIAQRARQLVDLAGFLDQNGADLVARLHEPSSRSR
jgi:homoserine kinase type II